MAEPQKPNESQPAAAPLVPLTVHAQYIKDLSFENPSAPQSLLPGQAMPQMSVGVTLDARKLEEPKNPNAVYEVILHIEATAQREQNTIFIVHLDYGVVCSVGKDFPEQHHHPLLMIGVPKLAFPFARQILAEVTTQAGFPPLLLNPVNFEAMYRAEYAAQQKAAEAG